MECYSASGNRVTLIGYNAAALIAEAYHLKRYQMSFAPSLPDYEPYYDIVANAPGPAIPTRSEFREMLQSLLADRFHLKIRRESKEMAVYALVVAKDGPKFKESAPDAVFHANHGVNGRRQNVVATKFTMENLADDIYVDRPVVDRTGLTGAYDIKLEATPEFRMERDPQPDDIRIFQAVQDQLGLRLVPQKVMFEVLVVDHVEKPTQN